MPGAGRCYLLLTLCIFIAGQAVLGNGSEESFEEIKFSNWLEIKTRFRKIPVSICLLFEVVAFQSFGDDRDDFRHCRKMWRFSAAVVFSILAACVNSCTSK